MNGSRVTVTVAGQEYAGTVESARYTLRGGNPVLTVELDEELPDGRTTYLASPSDVARR